ncbi:hypothetical protein BJ138DRAFT_746422 [Hygrophoropsis aurantiaca]|uniref:Uncharacterized protein n=1 Tax=Hygrophoropsis aurantiaca TaxID=72124 RepID=A0ACB7ZX28_9AGAM|nr:hypothetical protein BJ138DRAFT_746422 [Hygrophoropsis aurantiaca]
MFQNTSWITFIVSILHLAASLRTSNTSWSQEILLNLKTFVFPLAMADPEAIQLLQAIQTTYYFAAAGGALVAYDQVLTFSQEIDLVWNRNWSFMTILYLIARYSGSLSMVGLAAWYMCIDWTYSVIVNMYLAVSWAENIFLLAMQAILVIRVYALFNQSKKVLIFLATFATRILHIHGPHHR